MDSLKAALDTIQTLKKCECSETRKSLVAVLENHIKTSIKGNHELAEKLKRIEERMLKITNIAKDNYTTFEVSRGVEDDDL